MYWACNTFLIIQILHFYFIFNCFLHRGRMSSKIGFVGGYTFKYEGKNWSFSTISVTKTSGYLMTIIWSCKRELLQVGKNLQNQDTLFMSHLTRKQEHCWRHVTDTTLWSLAEYMDILFLDKSENSFINNSIIFYGYDARTIEELMAQWLLS